MLLAVLTLQNYSNIFSGGESSYTVTLMTRAGTLHKTLQKCMLYLLSMKFRCLLRSLHLYGASSVWRVQGPTQQLNLLCLRHHKPVIHKHLEKRLYHTWFVFTYKMQATGFRTLQDFWLLPWSRNHKINSDNQYPVGWYLSSVIYYKVIV